LPKANFIVIITHKLNKDLKDKIMAKRITIGDFDEGKILDVIALLESGGTKKAACDLLGIRYNTKKLDELITAYQERVEVRTRLRKKNRTKAVSKLEVSEWVTSYLSGESISSISEYAYRSEAVIKHHLSKYSALLRRNDKVSELEYFELPEESIKPFFKQGEIAWSPKHNCLVEVRKQEDLVVSVTTLNGDEKNAYVYSWDLASLDKLTEELDVNLKKFDRRLDASEVRSLLVEAMKKSNKLK